MNNKPTISGYSTALYATWFFIEDCDLLFDCGDGIMAFLTQKSRKIKYVFLSHADRDHITGLLQFNQLNAREGFPKIHFPADTGSVRHLAEFTKKFDPHVSGTQWIPIKSNETIYLNKQLLVRTHRNGHIPVPEGIHKSMGFTVEEHRQKLKPAFAHLSSEEIKKVVQQHGRAYLTNDVFIKKLAYSGDTNIENQEIWDGTETLIHEATFLPDPMLSVDKIDKHSQLKDVLQMVAELQIDRLVLTHFSTRYHPDEIDRHIVKFCKEFKLKIPVWRVLPGRFYENILAEEPIFS